jgi:hypothetical protein
MIIILDQLIVESSNKFPLDQKKNEMKCSVMECWYDKPSVEWYNLWHCSGGYGSTHAHSHMHWFALYRENVSDFH